MPVKSVAVICHLRFHIDRTNSLVRSSSFTRIFFWSFIISIVNTEAVGDGQLAIKLKQNSNRLSHEQTRLNAHNYEVSFVPETSDECILSILFNGDDGCKYINWQILSERIFRLIIFDSKYDSQTNAHSQLSRRRGGRLNRTSTIGTDMSVIFTCQK